MRLSEALAVKAHHSVGILSHTDHHRSFKSSNANAESRRDIAEFESKFGLSSDSDDEFSNASKADLSWSTQAHMFNDCAKNKRKNKIGKFEAILPLLEDWVLKECGIEKLDEGLLKLDSLTELNVGANQIKTIENIPASLKVLLAYDNEIQSMGLCENPNLLHLGLGYNKIDKLGVWIETLHKLEFLDLAYNNICDLQSLIFSLQQLKALRSLVLSGNPISMLPNYRAFICSSLPDLKYLDRVQVKDEVYNEDSEDDTVCIQVTIPQIVLTRESRSDDEEQEIESDHRIEYSCCIHIDLVGEATVKSQNFLLRDEPGEETIEIQFDQTFKVKASVALRDQLHFDGIPISIVLKKCTSIQVEGETVSEVELFSLADGFIDGVYTIDNVTIHMHNPESLPNGALIPCSSSEANHCFMKEATAIVSVKLNPPQDINMSLI